jgi:hypothetical protein
VSDTDTAIVKSLKVLDPTLPIREADIVVARSNVRFRGPIASAIITVSHKGMARNRLAFL